ncbi:MAG: helix-turn-helix transcriptional regulator [Owenweeksia sp.]
MDGYGQYFKALRESKGVTLREVERQTGVSNAYLSQLESGKVKQPSPNTLYKLAQFYQVSYEMLMEKVGYPVPKSSTVPKDHSVSSAAKNKLGGISHEEEVELLQYLKFIRNRMS